ncbi:MAG: hypothetical protein IJR56_00630 [Bacteroidaceae bacterium]|nr:hypothetical protein [Bacteroidaceae bacterium]MBQ9883201.1 hypothetical protein [Bacteroidaceae bacterium]
MRNFIVIFLSLLLFSCSSNDNEPVVEPEEEDIVIETPLPADAEPYTVYAIRHEKHPLKSECTFIFYFGENPYKEVMMHVRGMDKNGNQIFGKTVYSPLYKDYVSRDDPKWDEHSCSDSFTIHSLACERIAYFKFSLDLDGDGWYEPVTQPWEPVHNYYKDIQWP